MSPDFLKNLNPTKEFFIGIDSDGCVFDTMEIKQKECFCPNFIRYFHLQSVSKYARETWEFVNLYSKSRGINRFHALVEAVHLLGERPEVQARGVRMPDLTPVIEWTRAESRLGNPALVKYAAEVNDPVISQTLEWSLAVNRSVADMVYGIGPFPFVRESLQLMADQADAIVVSQTPFEALEREWKENKLDGHVRAIAGQEVGTKTEHLAMAAGGKYPPVRILMVGDAPGDQKAANANGVLFFPINPGHEEASWERLFREGLPRFFNGTFAGDYQKSLIEEFDRYLPARPPWKHVQTDR
jgi:phosphoglycolate phosphatase-like HAD superfamily hydrolase